MFRVNLLIFLPLWKELKHPLVFDPCRVFAIVAPMRVQLVNAKYETVNSTNRKVNYRLDKHEIEVNLSQRIHRKNSCKTVEVDLQVSAGEQNLKRLSVFFMRQPTYSDRKSNFSWHLSFCFYRVVFFFCGMARLEWGFPTFRALFMYK